MILLRFLGKLTFFLRRSFPAISQIAFLVHLDFTYGKDKLTSRAGRLSSRSRQGTNRLNFTQGNVKQTTRNALNMSRNCQDPSKNDRWLTPRSADMVNLIRYYGLIFVHFQPVPNPRFRDQVSRSERVWFDLAAKITDIHLEHMRFSLE